MNNLIEGFKEFLNEKQIITNEKILSQKAVDLYALRVYQREYGWKPTLPMCVLVPKNDKEISKIVKYCNDNKISIIPHGGGSGVLGGSEVVDKNSVVIDLSKLNKIYELNETNLTITCGSGTYIKDLENFLIGKMYMLGHYPQSMDLAQMGGLVSTRSIGQFSTGFGGIEDLRVGLEAVLPNGDIIKIKDNPRKSAGPDLRHIFLGGEGALGIITKVTVRIFPLPKAIYRNSFRLKSMDQGFEIIREIMKTGIRPSVVRLHDWLECSSKYDAYMEEEECLLIIRSDGWEDDIIRAHRTIIERIANEKGAIPAGSKPVEIWYEHRNDAVEEYEKYASDGILVDTIEISAPWDKIAKIYHDTITNIYYDKKLEDVIVYASGHSSHSYQNGTNLYFQFGAMPGNVSLDKVAKIHRRIWDIVMSTTLKNGGSIAHHHGVGKHRVKYIEEELGTSYQILQSIKHALDKNNIMNPGSLIPSND